MQNNEFIALVYDYYEKYGRLFPWRETDDPYQILVSEIMLQQTQTSRVLPKYEAFLACFPTVQVLAQAPLAEVLSYWQGLGYNRRALMLHRASQQVCSRFDGYFPDDPETLQTLPGLGPYTSSAVATFAFNTSTVFIETNIRTVFLHHFFPDQEKINDKEIFPLIEQTLDRDNPRQWYYALMDYGVMLKQMHGNANKRSAHYAKQSKFIGSDRQIRGEIVRQLAQGNKVSAKNLAKKFDTKNDRVGRILDQLVQDGLLAYRDKQYLIV